MNIPGIYVLIGNSWCAVSPPQLFLDALLSHFREETRRGALLGPTLLHRARRPDPYAVYSARGGLGRARAASRRGLLCSFVCPKSADF